VHRVIYDGLCLGLIREESRAGYGQVIQGLVRAGAQGVILGCTEIELLVRPEDSAVPLFPTVRIHAEAAVEYALRQAVARGVTRTASADAALWCQALPAAGDCRGITAGSRQDRH